MKSWTYTPQGGGTRISPQMHEEICQMVKSFACSIAEVHFRGAPESGRMAWQKDRQYGRRNYSELAFYRYQRVFGSSLHSRDIKRQEREVILGCGVMNKMTPLGIPTSHRAA